MNSSDHDSDNAPNLSARLAAVLENARFQRFILALIVLNAVLLGLQTSERIVAWAGPTLDLIDRMIVAVFVVEIAMRLFVARAAFFRDPWNWFDVLVVGTALIPANAHFAVLRALRVLRVMRLVAISPSLRHVVGAMLAALPGLAATASVLVLVFYVFAVIGTHLFANDFPAWFGHVGRSLYTLFQVMTLESWSMGISRPVMERFPYAWMFFVPFILTSTYTMLNLFIAIIVGATQAQADAERAEAEAAAPPPPDVAGELAALRAELAALRAELRRPGG
jgi:voltage-gated sodium channel